MKLAYRRTNEIITDEDPAFLAQRGPVARRFSEESESYGSKPRAQYHTLPTETKLCLNTCSGITIPSQGELLCEL